MAIPNLQMEATCSSEMAKTTTLHNTTFQRPYTNCHDSVKSHTLCSYLQMMHLLYSTAHRPPCSHYCTHFCYSAHVIDLNVAHLHIRLQALYYIVIKHVLCTSLYSTMENINTKFNRIPISIYVFKLGTQTGVQTPLLRSYLTSRAKTDS
jgi:hypothetical protein